MSASTKVLLALVAVAAFGVGWVVNSASIESEFDTSTMLKAELLEVDRSGPDSEPKIVPVQDKLEKLTLVNFWASWCAPCREEMPMFETMYRQHTASGFQVIGIAIDSPEKTRAMLDSMDISYPILYAEKTGMQIMESVGNPNGLLPYSLVLDERGAVLEQKVGTVHAEDVNAWLETYL